MRAFKCFSLREKYLERKGAFKLTDWVLGLPVHRHRVEHEWNIVESDWHEIVGVGHDGRQVRVRQG